MSTDRNSNEFKQSSLSEKQQGSLSEKQQGSLSENKQGSLSEKQQGSLSENAPANAGKSTKKAGIPAAAFIGLAALLVIVLCLALLLKKNADKKPTEEAQSGATAAEAQAEEETAEKVETAETAKNSETARTSETAKTAETASTANTMQPQTAAAGSSTAAEHAAVLSPEMEALEQNLREELSEKNGYWSLYLCRLDSGEEIGINANDQMISASLIKLYVAGCYFDQVDKGNISDDYHSQLYYMISASDNGSTNQLIDLLGMDRINAFIQEHGYKAGQLNRRMLEKNGMENYTSSRDCGRVLRDIYKGTYVNQEASETILTAMREQIDRNLNKIPAGVPEGVETANKTGELLTTDANGMNVLIQNDAAIIFAEGHPYVLVLMTATSGVGEGQIHQEIAAVSSEVYNAVISMETGDMNSPASVGVTADHAE